jgi:hypothetical protein
MAKPTDTHLVPMTVQQIRETYAALNYVYSACASEISSLFNEHKVSCGYNLPDSAAFRYAQLRNRESWAKNAMVILSEVASSHGFPVNR